MDYFFMTYFFPKELKLQILVHVISYTINLAYILTHFVSLVSSITPKNLKKYLVKGCRKRSVALNGLNYFQNFRLKSQFIHVSEKSFKNGEL